MVVSVPFFMGCVVDVPDSLLTPINVVGFGLVSLSLTVPQHRHHEELQNPSSTDSYNRACTSRAREEDSFSQEKAYYTLLVPEYIDMAAFPCSIAVRYLGRCVLAKLEAISV